MSKHTPGPWGVDPFVAQVNEIKTGCPLLKMQWPSDDRSEEETFANANLIAAAPDMLEAHEYQQEVDEWIESADCESPFFKETLRLKLNTARDMRITAIAKAKGKLQ